MAKQSNIRTRELAQIHIAKKELGLEEDTYRDMLWTIGRVRSSGDLDHAGRRRVLEHLASRGWINKKASAPRKPNEWAFIDTAAQDKRPLLRKICVQCRELGVGKEYAEGVAKRQHGIDRKLEMMSYGELWILVGALERTLRFKDAK